MRQPFIYFQGLKNYYQSGFCFRAGFNTISIAGLNLLITPEYKTITIRNNIYEGLRKSVIINREPICRNPGSQEAFRLGLYCCCRSSSLILFPRFFNTFTYCSADLLLKSSYDLWAHAISLSISPWISLMIAIL